MSVSLDLDETIVAQATSRDPDYERGIIRISGEHAVDIFTKSFEQPNSSGQIGYVDIDSLLKPTMVPGFFRCSDLANRIPVKGLIWPNCQSYTRQKSVEIHTIGSQPILDSIVSQLCSNGARLAEPGEFTMRAFLAGRLDLTEAEAVLGVIDSNDKQQLDVALKQLAGGLSRPLKKLREDLISTLAHLEAGLDFVEEDIEFISSTELRKMLSNALSQLQMLQRMIDQRSHQISESKVVLFGSPNAGKSSLFNLLSEVYSERAQRAIVSSQSGTTRDFLTSDIVINGTRVQLVDTAGVEDFKTETEIPDTREELGTSQSRTQQREAVVELFCIDSTRPMTHWETDQLQPSKSNRIICLTKCDLGKADSNELDPLVRGGVFTSSKTRFGIDQLASRVIEIIESFSSCSVAGTSIRCLSSCKNAVDSLERATNLIDNEIGDEFVAAEVRIALDEVGKITGVVYTDDILDIVFGQFCIGK